MKRQLLTRILAVLLSMSLLIAVFGIVIVASPSSGSIVIESKKALKGDEFTIEVKVKNNPGFAYLELTPVYPTELTLVNVENGTLIRDFTPGSKQYIWTDNEDVYTDGTLVKLTFTTTQEVELGQYAISFIMRNCINYDEKTVNMSVEGGLVELIDFVYGDATGDRVVNGVDVVRLIKYIANYDYDTGTSTVEINPGADANGDGEINGLDVVRLKKYIANYDYDTETSTIALGPNTTPINPGQQELTGKEALPGYENVNFGGRTFLIASCYDVDSDWDDASDFWVEGITNDAVNDAVFERNRVMSELYNCTIAVDDGGWDNGFNAAIASGSDKYIAGSSEFAIYGEYANGNFYNVLKLGIDLTQNWWDQNFIADSSCDGKLFGIIGDFSLHAMSATWIMFYNKDIYESKFSNIDIYQLVREKKWTMDVMADMIDKIKNDANGDSYYDFSDGSDADTIGMITTAFNDRGLYFASGLRYVTKSYNSTTGSFVSALNNQARGYEVMDKIIALCNTPGYITGGYSNVQRAIQNGTTLFAGEVLDVLRRMAGTENLRVGVLPQPLYEEGQDSYHCYVTSRAAFMCIPTSFSDMGTIADFFTLFAYHSYKLVRSAFVDSYKYNYADDADSAEMVDMIIDNRVFDPGYLGNFSGEMDSYITTMITNQHNQYTQAAARFSNTDTTKLTEYAERIASIDDDYVNHPTPVETTVDSIETTTLPVFARFDFGTDTYAEDQGLTSHDYLTSVLAYDESCLSVNFEEDYWDVWTIAAYDAENEVTEAFGQKNNRFALIFNDIVTFDFDDEIVIGYGGYNGTPYKSVGDIDVPTWSGRHQYMQVRLVNNTTNNIWSIRFIKTGDGAYFTTCVMGNLYLQGGEPTSSGEYRRTCEKSSEWATYTYDFFLASGLSSGRGHSAIRHNEQEAGGKTWIEGYPDNWFDYKAYVYAHGDPGGTNVTWNPGKSFTALELNIFSGCYKYGLGDKPEGMSEDDWSKWTTAHDHIKLACDTRENIIAGMNVKLDYLIFGCSPEQLDGYKSYIEQNA